MFQLSASTRHQMHEWGHTGFSSHRPTYQQITDGRESWASLLVVSWWVHTRKTPNKPIKSKGKEVFAMESCYVSSCFVTQQKLADTSSLRKPRLKFFSGPLSHCDAPTFYVHTHSVLLRLKGFVPCPPERWGQEGTDKFAILGHSQTQHPRAQSIIFSLLLFSQ